MATGARVRSPSPEAIREAAALLADGLLIGLPTETVYGLAADATNDRAVAAVFAAKDRPQFNPLIAHFRDLDAVAEAAELSPLARRLAERFWPGPLTLVLRRRSGASLSLLASAGLDTVATRVPAHPVAHAVLREFGRPLAAPSANRSGKLSPTTAAHVLAELGDRVATILDAGPCPIGIESTILDLTSDRPVLLRPGAVTEEQLASIAGALEKAAAGAPVRAPGMLSAHYAPDRPLRLEASEAVADEVLIAFGPNPVSGAGRTLSLSPSGDLTEAAARLFATLREADASGLRRIAVMPIPDQGIGRAINDRLRRAASPRS